jgi:TolB-like protein/DNA-binding winged helix-turn-helix (wHTH) protein/tetratricopeptide (TPR) repeat protein
MQTLDTPQSVAFGPFVLDLAARTLLARGEKVTLSSRGFDILALLIAEHSRVVSKEEIITVVWRGLAVEENNLAVQISTLRRALADHTDGQTIILTVPGQGYRFVGKLDAPAEPPPVTLPATDALTPEFSAMRPAIESVAPTTARRPRWSWVIAAVPVLALASFLGWQFQGTKEAPRLSIAVLPFRNLSDDRSQDYLADAISDDLTTDLAHLPGSVVIARESSDVYKGHAVPAGQIGRALNVRYLLEGSLRPVEKTFSVNAQLIDASNGSHLWATQFAVPRDKLNDAQTMIVGSIASALHVKLIEVESARSLKERPKSPDAEDFFLQARSLHDKATSIGDLSSAQRLLERAIAESPDYKVAIIELSTVLLDKVSLYDDPDDAVDFPLAKQMTETALAIAPHDDSALTAAGRMKVLQARTREGEASFKAAIEINPNNVEAHVGLFGGEFRLGKFESALAEVQNVLRLDPQGARSKPYHAYLGFSYFMLGRWQDAIDALQRSLAEGADTRNESLTVTEWTHLFLIAAYDRAGESGRARELFGEYQIRWPNRSIWRVSSYFWKPQVEHKGFQALRDALQHVGMPFYGRSAANAHADESRQGDYDPAPQQIAGAEAVDIAQFQTMRGLQPSPIILDVGLGAAMLPGMTFVADPDSARGGIADCLRSRRQDTPIIIVGAGWLGWDAAKATRQAVAAGAAPVYWLRGGEEALAASQDKALFNNRIP